MPTRGVRQDGRIRSWGGVPKLGGRASHGIHKILQRQDIVEQTATVHSLRRSDRRDQNRLYRDLGWTAEPLNLLLDFMCDRHPHRRVVILELEQRPSVATPRHRPGAIYLGVTCRDCMRPRGPEVGDFGWEEATAAAV